MRFNIIKIMRAHSIIQRCVCLFFFFFFFFFFVFFFLMQIHSMKNALRNWTSVQYRQCLWKLNFYMNQEMRFGKELEPNMAGAFGTCTFIQYKRYAWKMKFNLRRALCSGIGIDVQALHLERFCQAPSLMATPRRSCSSFVGEVK